MIWIIIFLWKITLKANIYRVLTIPQTTVGKLESENIYICLKVSKQSEKQRLIPEKRFLLIRRHYTKPQKTGFLFNCTYCTETGLRIKLNLLVCYINILCMLQFESKHQFFVMSWTDFYIWCEMWMERSAVACIV